MRKTTKYVLAVLVMSTAMSMWGCSGSADPRSSLQPKGLVLRVPVSKVIKPAERLQLDGYVDYGGSPGSVPAAIRKQDAAGFAWAVTPGGGAVDQSTQTFTATEPGIYTVTVKHLSFTATTQVKVEREFSGRYTGLMDWPKGAFGPWEFTVDAEGGVTGKFRWSGNGVASGDGTFVGSVSKDGSLSANGTARKQASKLVLDCTITGSITPGVANTAFTGRLAFSDGGGVEARATRQP